jgi:hypothetical protein
MAIPLWKTAARGGTKYPYKHVLAHKGAWLRIKSSFFVGREIAVDFRANADFNNDGFMPHGILPFS